MKFSNCLTGLHGTLQVPGDKSISHRAVMFGAISSGTTEITHFLPGADCLSTIGCFRKMGIDIEQEGETVLVHGKGLHGLKAPESILDCGNSGTTTRLISGILSGQDFVSELTGDASIQKRPMGRIIRPLRQMGAFIESLGGNDCAPLRMGGTSLHGSHYLSPVASAQVKSCVLLAGLYADAPTSVTEPALSRNHTELMLQQFGARVISQGLTATVQPGPQLQGQQIAVPGDISSAAYYLAAGLLVPNSEIRLLHTGTNPTRDGMLRVIKAMGGSVIRENESGSFGEPAADLIIKSSSLHGTVIEGELIPTLIDELPIIAILAAAAEGTTIIRDAAELKVKESNRLELIVKNLKEMGADAEETEDGMIIHGGRPLHGAVIDCRMDHRIAMSFAIAAQIAEGITDIPQADCVGISYPDFYADLQSLK